MDACEVYDPLSDSWSALPPMPTPRGFLATGVIKDKIYVVGGEDYGDRCECFDPNSLSWDTLHPTPVYNGRYRTGLCAAVANNRLYIFGGLKSGRVDYNYCDEYNPTSDNWYSITSMPTARYGAAAAYVNGKIYVIGGEQWPRTYLTKNEEFSPQLENNPPTIGITSPSENAVVDGTITIDGTASDSDGAIQKVQVRIDSGSWITASGTTSWSYTWDTTTVNNGDHTIYARSYDGKDYSNIESTDVTVNNKEYTSPDDGSTDGNDTPGFELVLVTFVIALVLLWKRKNENNFKVLVVTKMLEMSFRWEVI